MKITTTTAILVRRIEHKCPHCSEQFSEEYTIAPNGGVMGSPIIKCKSCGKEFYNSKIIEYYDLPEETAKTIETSIPREEKIWHTICLTNGCLFIIMLIIVFKFFNKLFDNSVSPVITIAVMSLFSSSLIFAFVCNAHPTDMLNHFIGEKRRSKRRMSKIEYVSKLEKYKEKYTEEYKHQKINSAMNMSTLDFIKKADELMSE